MLLTSRMERIIRKKRKRMYLERKCSEVKGEDTMESIESKVEDGRNEAEDKGNKFPQEIIDEA